MEPPCWCTPTLRPENSVIIWNLLWLSARLIICTEQTGIYISTVPNTVNFWMRKNHEISLMFFDKRARSSMSFTAKTLKFKISRLLEKRKNTTTTKAREKARNAVIKTWLISRPEGPQTSNKLLMQPKAEQREHIDSIKFRTTSNEEHLSEFAISRKKNFW